MENMQPHLRPHCHY